MNLLSSWRQLFGLPDIPVATMQEGDDTYGTAFVSDAVLRHHVEARNAEFTARIGDAATAYLEETLRYRAAKYSEHLSKMAPSAEMTLWALQMASSYSPYVRVHNFVHDNWLTALLVIRYGEEPDSAKTTDGSGWPLEFSDADKARAMSLLAGRDFPDFLTILPRYLP